MRKIFVSLMVLFALSPAVVFAKNESVSTERQQFQQKVQELRDAKAESREAVKTQVLTRAKTLATKSIDKIIAKYQHFIKVVSALPNISENNKAEYKSKIEAQVAILKAKKAEVTAATSVVEIKAVMETVKSEVRKSNEAVKLMVIAIKKTHIENILLKMNELLIKVEARISEEKTSGVDVTEHELVLTNVKGLLAEASTQITSGANDEAKARIVSARNELSKLINILDNNNSEAE